VGDKKAKDQRRSVIVAEPVNPAQIAPGEEAGRIPLDEPYVGYAPSQHIGYPLNGSFQLGAQAGRN
jgi:hypothetical protein